MKYVYALLFLLLIFIPGTIYLSAYTVATLWGWFVSTTFGLPLLTKAQAYGLSIFVSYLFSSSILMKLELIDDETKENGY